MGRGRGRQVISVAKTADVIIIMSTCESSFRCHAVLATNVLVHYILPVDATKSSEQRRLLEAELEAVGIRLNTKKPDSELEITPGNANSSHSDVRGHG